MKYFLVVLFIVVSSFFLLFGCSGSQNSKPFASGKSGELIVVIDSLLWKSLPGKIIYDSLTVPFPAIPQLESTFRPIQIQNSGFKNILKLHRNILMVDIGPLPDGRNFLLSYKNNLWASPQLVMSLRARSVDELEAALLSVMPTIIARFKSAEENRLIESLVNLKQLQNSNDLHNAMKIKFPLTDDFFIAKNEDNYVWVRKETVHMSMGFQFSRIPYTNDSMFNALSLVAMRDSISKKHIPGPAEGSYMATDLKYPIEFTALTIDSAYAVEIKGLWKTEGDFMGGPFLSYLIHDKSKNELIFIDAFIYAPKFNKREYVKQMSAMVKSMKID